MVSKTCLLLVEIRICLLLVEMRIWLLLDEMRICLLLVEMRGQVHLKLHYLLGFLLKLSTTQTRINFTYPCCFYKRKYGEVLNNTLPRHNFNELVFTTFILIFCFILTKFLQKDILKPFMSNELHP